MLMRQAQAQPVARTRLLDQTRHVKLLKRSLYTNLVCFRNASVV